MATRNRYLLAYDIRHPHRLRRVHQAAKGYGDPLQYSVFVCDLTDAELATMRIDLRAEADLSEDSIVIFDLGPPQGRGIECVEFLGQRRPLPSDEPSIW